MKIGLFTDTYFPQVSGVATSIRTARIELEKLGHEVYIFTTTDKGIERDEDERIFRLPSIPFFAFKDRRFAYAGSRKALEKARELGLDIVHTQTEFSLGLIGIWVAEQMKIPVIHTYHTQYEDYTRYIADGLLIRPGMVKYIARSFLNQVYGVVCPSEIVENLLQGYKIKPQTRVIPTGIDLDKFAVDAFSEEEVAQLRQELGIAADQTMLLSLSRISYEKNIQAVLMALPQVFQERQDLKLVVVGDGPYKENLEDMADKLGIKEHLVFTGMVDPAKTMLYYKAADFFVSASTSETQGLTYLEALAMGTAVIAQENPYLETVISDPVFGSLYQTETDLAATILTAMNHSELLSEEKLNAKRQEISAQTFGKKLEVYYKEIIELNRFRNHQEGPRLEDVELPDENPVYHLLFSIDDDYVDQFKVTLYSLYLNAKKPQLEVYVLQKEPLEKTAEIEDFCQSLGMVYHPIVIGEKAFEDAPTTDRYPETIYYRLLAHEYLPESLDKILYLDADILAINDFRPLYDLELTDYLYAAASHVEENGLVDLVNKVRLQNFDAETYYNSGVLLMNLKAIRQKVKRQEILDYIAESGDVLLLPDQDVLNALYGRDIFTIPDQVYNYDTRYVREYQSRGDGEWDLNWVLENTVFLHFCGREKPWLKGAVTPLAILYKHYQQRVKHHKT